MTQPNYGFTQDPQGQPNVQVQVVQGNQGNGLAVAGMVLGILALVLCWVPFLDQILALLAIIFGAVGISKANKIGGKGKGMAGLITGILGMIAGIVIIYLAWQQAKLDLERNGFHYRSEVTVVHKLDRA